jgi:hypothetical protein
MQSACVMLPGWLYNIFFSTLPHKRHDFFFGGGGGLLKIKCVFWFSAQLCLGNISHSREIQRDIFVRGFMWNTRYSGQILIKLEFSWQIFEMYSNTKFHGNSSSGSRAVPCGQTDMTKLIDAFRNFTNSPKNHIYFTSHISGPNIILPIQI